MGIANKYPIVNANILRARQPAVTPEHKVLIVGQSNDVDVTSGALVTEIGSDETVIKAKFGAKEHITQGILAFREMNKVTRLDAIALNDGAGTQATGSIALTGTATENGTIYISVGSEYHHRLAIPVAKDDTATVIGDAIDTAVLADDTIPVTSANVTGTVTFTAVNDGTEGNSIGLKVEGTIAGISYTLTAFSGGATDPTLTTLYDGIANIRYNTIIIPSYAGTTTITLLDNRFNPTNTVLDGIGIYAITDTANNHGTNLDALNTRSLVYIANKILTDANQKGGACLELPFVIASRKGAVRALRGTIDANIAKYMVNGLTKSDIATNGYPYWNTPIPEFPLIPTGRNFSSAEIDTITSKGGTTIVNDATDTMVILNKVPVVSSSIAKPTLANEETIRIMRETRFFRTKTRYAQHKLGTEGEAKQNQAIVTKESFIADAKGDWQYFVDNGLIREQTADGRSTFDLWKEAIEQTFTQNFLTGTITDDFLCAVTVALEQVDENIIPDYN